MPVSWVLGAFLWSESRDETGPIWVLKSPRIGGRSSRRTDRFLRPEVTVTPGVMKSWSSLPGRGSPL